MRRCNQQNMRIIIVLLCTLLPIALFAQSDVPKDVSAGNPTVSPTPAPASNAASTAGAYSFPSNKRIAKHGFRGVAGVRSTLGSAVGASWGTWVTDSPEEWGTKPEGWGKRFGAGFIDRGINQSTLVGLSIATHQDPIYYVCACKGLWSRTGHALRLTVEARNRRGEYVFSVANIVSPFVGPVVTRNSIYPDRFNTIDGLQTGGWHLLGNAGWNLVREFFIKGPVW